MGVIEPTITWLQIALQSRFSIINDMKSEKIDLNNFKMLSCRISGRVMLSRIKWQQWSGNPRVLSLKQFLLSMIDNQQNKSEMRQRGCIEMLSPLISSASLTISCVFKSSKLQRRLMSRRLDPSRYSLKSAWSGERQFLVVVRWSGWRYRSLIFTHHVTYCSLSHNVIMEYF